tara:strand:- start:688 stop:948 length:261 start_codon:yes stop_codon:yes gene_type:complete
MKPSKELLKLAKQKIKTCKPNKSNKMQSIRLTSDEKSFTLFYQIGIAYIGSYTEDNLAKFFKNKDVYELKDRSTFKIMATMQKIYN